MASVNAKTIEVEVPSTRKEYNVPDAISSGDSSAYTLEIKFSDITSISGTCNLHFVLGDGTTADRDDSDGVTITDNVVTFLLESSLYSMDGLSCWVQFIDSNVYTPLKLTFTGIRIMPMGDTLEVATFQPYPEWAVEIRDFDVDIGTVTALDTSEPATASITGTFPHKLLNLGLPKGDTGETGATGEPGTTVESVAFVNDDIVFTLTDESTVALVDAKIALKGETGPQGEIGPTGPEGPQGPEGPAAIEDFGEYRISDNQSIPASTYTGIVLNSVFRADATEFELATGKVKVLAAGLYLVHYGVSFRSNATGVRHLLLYKNAELLREIVTPPPSDVTATLVSVEIVECAANDLIELKCRQSTAGALDAFATKNTFVRIMRLN